MSHGLLVARSDVPGGPAPADGVAADVALARGTVEDADVETARGGEVALQVHVQILADRFGPGVPAAHVAGERHGDRVDGGGDTDRGAVVETGEAGAAPEDVGDADEGADVLGVAVEDDGGHVEGCGAFFGVFAVEFAEEVEVC